MGQNCRKGIIMKRRDSFARWLANVVLNIFATKEYRRRLTQVIECGLNPQFQIVVTTKEGIEFLRDEGIVAPGPESNMGEH